MIPHQMPIWRTKLKEFAIVKFLFFKIYALVTDTFLGKEKKRRMKGLLFISGSHKLASFE